MQETQAVLSVALQSMHQDIARLDRVGMNLANALTPGYKRDVVVASPFLQVADRLAGPGGLAQPDATGSVQILSDAHPGTLKSTEQSLDLALAGPGYFEVATDKGPAYTRQGNFHVDDRGRLVNAQGYPVLGKGGEIYLNSPTPVIDASGQVFEGSRAGVVTSKSAAVQTIGQIKVVDFDNPKTLQRLGDGLVAGSDNPSQMKDADIQIRQGFLENSNVNSMQEMLQLMQTMRHFESMQKVALGYDEMMGTAIRRLGELS